MKSTLRAIAITVITLVVAGGAYADCGFNPVVIDAPDSVVPGATGYAASVTLQNGMWVQWSITSGAIIGQTTTANITFSTHRQGPLVLRVTYGNDQGCSSFVTKEIPIVHLCTVTADTTPIIRSYAGGIVPIPVESTCNWSARFQTSTQTVGRITGPGGATGNGTVTLEVTPEATLDGTRAIFGTEATLFVGDKDIQVRRTGRRRAGHDFNFDGKADLVWRNTSTGLVFIQMMNGITPTGVTDTVAPPAGGGWHLAAIADEFSAYAKPDLVWRNVNDFRMLAYAMDGTKRQTTVEYQNVEQNGDWTVVGSGHFLDTLKQTPLRRNNVTGAINLRDAYQTNHTFWHEPDPNWKIVAITDFDGDNKDDLLWRHAVNGRCFMQLWRGNVNPQPIESRLFHYEPDLNWQIVTAGDVDGDGRADILWRNMTDGRIWVQRMNGFNQVGSGVIWVEPNTNWKVQGMADLNFDGRQDLVWRHATTGTVFGMLLNGTTVIGSGIIHYEPNPDWQIVHPAGPVN